MCTHGGSYVHMLRNVACSLQRRNHESATLPASSKFPTVSNRPDSFFVAFITFQIGLGWDGWHLFGGIGRGSIPRSKSVHAPGLCIAT